MVLLFMLAPRLRPVIWVGVFCLATLGGCEESHGRAQRQRVQAPSLLAPSSLTKHRGTGVLKVTSWPSLKGPDKWKASAVVLDWQETGENCIPPEPEIQDGMMLSGQGPAPQPGTVLAGIFTLTVPADGDLPGSFDYREFLAGRHLKWLGRMDQGRRVTDSELVSRILAPIRASILTRLQLLFPPREADLTAAVLLGQRTADSRDGALPFADLGLAHLFAVSGLHVGILLGIVSLPGRLLGLSAAGRLLVMIIFLGFYTVLTGLPGSVVRAAGLGLLVMGASVLGRRPDSLRLLGLLFWATTIFQPQQVLDTGLRLSYLAAGGILTVVPRLKPAAGSSRMISGLEAALGVSLAAQWFTLPQVALSFGRFSLLAPLANIIVVPLFGLGVWTMVLALTGHLIWPWLGESLAAVAWLLLRSLTGLVSWVASLTGGMNVGLAPTHPAMGLAWVFLTMVGLSQFRRLRSGLIKSRREILSIFLLIFLGHGLFAFGGFGLIMNGHLRVWQFDVGQGDCSLVVFPDGWKCLVDTGGMFGFGKAPPDGPVNRSVRPLLKRGWVRRLDAVVLTHGHRDHTGGSAVLARDFSVVSWVSGGRAARDLERLGLEIQGTNSGGPATLHSSGPWSLEVIYPTGSLPTDFSENDRSLVLTLNHRGNPCMVWSGDLETRGESLLMSLDLLPENVQVWKAGHHGSNTSGHKAWLDRLNPALVLISCGTENKYGHPSHGLYVSRGDTLPILRTDLEGTIWLEWDPNGALTWKTKGIGGHFPPVFDRFEPPP